MQILRIVIALALVAGLLVMIVARDEAPAPAGPTAPEASPAATPTGVSQPDTSPGLRCIRGGTSREEVRAIMGEPDSVAFGDWLYGRSSITFGYGVVLDYANAGGNLVVCP